MPDKPNYPTDCPILDPDHAIHEHVRSKGGRRSWDGGERRKLRSRFAPWVDVAKIALLIASVEFLFRLGVMLRTIHVEVQKQTVQLERIGVGVEHVHSHATKGN